MSSKSLSRKVLEATGRHLMAAADLSRIDGMSDAEIKTAIITEVDGYGVPVPAGSSEAYINTRFDASMSRLMRDPSVGMTVDSRHGGADAAHAGDSADVVHVYHADGSHEVNLDATSAYNRMVRRNETAHLQPVKYGEDNTSDPVPTVDNGQNDDATEAYNRMVARNRGGR